MPQPINGLAPPWENRAGHCLLCGALVWAVVHHPKTGAATLMWPRPSTRFGTLSDGRHSWNAVTYCGAHVPAVGSAGPPLANGSATTVAKVLTAAQRHGYWYSDRFGEVFRAWLTDELLMPEHDRALVMAEWERDRQEAHAGG